MTPSNGNIFRVSGHLCVTSEFPSQRPVTRRFDVFFDLRLNKQLSKQSLGWWFETLSRPLWRHSNDILDFSEPEKGAHLGIPTMLLAFLWVSARKTYLHCYRPGVTSLLHWPIDLLIDLSTLQIPRFDAKTRSKYNTFAKHYHDWFSTLTTPYIPTKCRSIWIGYLAYTFPSFKSSYKVHLYHS